MHRKTRTSVALAAAAAAALTLLAGCGQKGPLKDDGTPKCAADPTCKTADGKTVILSELEDNINRRCVDQKRRSASVP